MIRTLAFLLAAVLFSTGALAQKVAVTGPGTSFFDLNTPQIIAFAASDSFQTNISTANNYKVPVQPTQANDTLILSILYPHGDTISSITNSDSTTWGAAVCTADAGVGNYIAAVYVFPNIAAGVNNFTITASSNNWIPFQYAVLETNNITNTSPTNGSLCTASIAPTSGGVISPGSFTPTANNDANGGNVIFNYTTLCGGSQATPNIPSKFTPTTNFGFLHAGISVTQGFPTASEWWTQPTQASVTPSITATGETAAGDCFNSVSVALKVSKGTGASNYPFSINVAKIIHEEIGFGATAQTIYYPTTGNLRVLAVTWDIGNVPTINATSSDTCNGSNTFTVIGTTGSHQAYQQGCTPNPNLKITIATPGASGQGSMRFYDIRNAAASSFVNSTDQNDGRLCTTGTNTDAPAFTPGVSNGITIASLGFGTGPGNGLGAGSPSGAQSDLTVYTNETDIDNLENADNQGHLNFSTNATQHWNWILNSSSSSCYGIAAAYQ